MEENINTERKDEKERSESLLRFTKEIRHMTKLVSLSLSHSRARMLLVVFLFLSFC